MKVQLDITKSVTKSCEMDFADEDALDDYLAAVENGEVDFDEIPGTIEDSSVEVDGVYEIEE